MHVEQQVATSESTLHACWLNELHFQYKVLLVVKQMQHVWSNMMDMRAHGVALPVGTG
jgi:hypothetical protein